MTPALPRTLLIGLLFFACQQFTNAADTVSDARPNVLFVMLDDVGWTDLSCFGGRMLTPHLDQLSQQGMRFTDAHSPAPNCSPSRAGVLTGRIPARVGIYGYLPDAHPMHLRDEEVTVAELARREGYRTGHFGKWHLSDLDNDAQPGPLDQGFEYSLATSNNAAPSHLNPVNFHRNGKPVGKLPGYSCQIVIDETIDWLDQIGAKKEYAEPFLACVWFHEPHTPIASPPELIDACLKRHPDLTRREAEYLANIENVDRAMGRLLTWLDERGLAEDTVIWFTSDNGPLNAFSKGNLRGFKSNVWEGGHRVPLMRDEQIIERPVDQNTITRRYTEEAIQFIRDKKDESFFVYLPHSLPHIPLFASDKFRGRSDRGLYGDVIEEIDWSVGQVLDTLRELKLDEKTLVVFTTDNGPWLSFQTHGGSAGPLRAGKGTTFEGGQRVPTIFWWPETVKPGVVTELGSTLDLMATFATLTGTRPPDDRKLDSYDLSPVLLGTGKSPRQEMFYWTRAELHAVRSGPWKLHVKQREPVNYGRQVVLKKPELYHLERDLSEAYDVADQYPDIVERLLAMMKAHEADIEPHEDMLAIPLEQ